MRRFHAPLATRLGALRPNLWDLAAAPLVFGVLVLLVVVARQTSAPLVSLDTAGITLDPASLPGYALRTTARMLAALAVSLIFTLTIGTLAAKSRRVGALLVPVLDILQSVPVLGYISFTVVFFLSLFPGSVMGPELAAIFAIFTSQAWNMTFSFYQSLRTVPQDLVEASRMFQLSAWQRFWRLEVPFAIPGLVWNMMVSMSGGWFFVVAAEAITVGDHSLRLPGLGSYVAQAIDQRDLGAIFWALGAMVVVIAIYDRLMFRPLVAWADRFRLDQTQVSAAPESRVLDFVRRTRVLRAAVESVRRVVRVVTGMRIVPPTLEAPALPALSPRLADFVWFAAVGVLALWGLWLALRFVGSEIGWAEALEVLSLGAITLLRVVVLIAIALMIWVPAGAVIGLRPALAARIQPLAQALAAFPANLLFPVAALAIVRFHLDPDIWLSPLMILGTQWYILFNVIAGASVVPVEIRDAGANFQVKGVLWWRRVMLPAVMPYAVTGAITASGGAWNASIVAEAVSWGDQHFVAHGLGSYIARYTEVGDFPRIALGIVVMSVLVVGVNRALWRPLYNYAERRFRLD
jgi:NitT/TauT family transport system permease protein